jgi:hypothetical protein
MCVKFELEEAARCRHVMVMRNSVLLLDLKVLGTCVYLVKQSRYRPGVAQRVPGS